MGSVRDMIAQAPEMVREADVASRNQQVTATMPFRA